MPWCSRHLTLGLRSRLLYLVRSWNVAGQRHFGLCLSGVDAQRGRRLGRGAQDGASSCGVIEHQARYRPIVNGDQFAAARQGHKNGSLIWPTKTQVSGEAVRQTDVRLQFAVG